MPPKQTTPKGLSPKIMRQKHVTRSNQRRENGHIFVPYTLPEYDSDTVSQRTKYRNHARRTLKALDDQAKMDERAAAHKLFAGAAGSSTQLASMVSPKKEDSPLPSVTPATDRIACSGSRACDCALGCSCSGGAACGNAACGDAVCGGSAACGSAACDHTACRGSAECGGSAACVGDGSSGGHDGARAVLTSESARPADRHGVPDADINGPCPYPGVE